MTPTLTATEAASILAITRAQLRPNGWTVTARDIEAINRGIARCGIDGRKGPMPVYSSVGA